MKFRIEQVIAANSRFYVVARALEAVDFSLSEHPRLGGVSIEKWLTRPRAIDKQGEQDPSRFVFCLTLEYAQDPFTIGQVAELAP